MLAEEGIVHSLDRRGETRYGLADRPHHHVVCGDCGRVAEVVADEVRELLTPIGARTGFSFAGQSLTLTGRCDGCITGDLRGGQEHPHRRYAQHGAPDYRTTRPKIDSCG